MLGLAMLLLSTWLWLLALPVQDFANDLPQFWRQLCSFVIVPAIVLGVQFVVRREMVVPTNRKHVLNRAIVAGVVYLVATMILALLINYGSYLEVFRSSRFFYWLLGMIVFLTLYLINDLSLVRFLNDKKVNHHN